MVYIEAILGPELPDRLDAGSDVLVNVTLPVRDMISGVNEHPVFGSLR